jgi:hypothetical protein
VKTGAKLVTAVRVFVNPVVYSAQGAAILSFLFYAHCQSKHFSMTSSPAAATIGSARSTQSSSLFQPTKLVKTEPTYHFYLWVRKRRDTKALIDTAFESVNKDIAKRAKRKGKGKRKADPKADKDDIPTAVKAQLAKSLQAIVEDVGTALRDRVRDAAEPPRSGGPRQFLILLDSIALPLTDGAMDRIHVDVVAEALLRDARKWNPDESDPEESDEPTEPPPEH